MKRSFFSRASSLALWSFVMFLFCHGCTSVKTVSPPGSGPESATALKEKTARQPKSCPTVEISPFVVPYYPPPSQLDLCGEPVPLQSQEVLERFDKEFTLIVYNHAQVYLWLKRMERYFPWLEEQLRCNNLPDDLKYVAIAESDLLPNACSPKGAAGPWQFMPSTGASYGLSQKESVDRRYDFEYASRSALRYLNDLHNRFKSWSLAIAAYNCGEGRVGEEMRSQRTGDFYQLKLPQETERYVLRILAIKTVLGNPSLYGYSLPTGQGYPPLKTDRTCITLNSGMSLQEAASAAGTTVREMKRLNPSLRSDEIPAGTHELNLPEGSAKSFEGSLQPERTTPAARESAASPPKDELSSGTSAPPKAQNRSRAVKHHIVKKGETLSVIGRKYSVNVGDLRKANKLKADKVTPGQELVIP